MAKKPKPKPTPAPVPAKLVPQNAAQTALTQLFTPDAAQGALAGQNLYQSTVTNKVVDDPYRQYVDQLGASASTDYQNSGRTSTGLQSALDRMTGLANTAGDRDPTLQGILNRLLTESKGYTADEEQRFREEGQGGMNRALQTGLRAARGIANGANFGGGAAGALGYGAMQNFATANRDLTRKLFLDNLARKDTKLTAAQGLAGTLDQNSYDRRFQTTSALGEAQFQSQQANRQDRLANFDRVRDITQGQQTFAANLQKLNNDSLTAWQLGDMNAGLSGGSYVDTRKDTETAFDLQKKAIEKMGGSAGGGGGGGSSGAPSTSVWDSAPSAPSASSSSIGLKDSALSTGAGGGSSASSLGAYQGSLYPGGR